MTKNETMKSIAATARICWTCGGTPNADNFGGLCDSCTAEKESRLSRTVKVLESAGLANTQEYRALKHLGY